LTAVPGARTVDPAAEAERLAGERAHGPAKVLHTGDVIRVYAEDGEVFTGRIGRVDPFGVPHGEHMFGVVCWPVGGAGR
jgi:hypothetical protein